MTIQQMQMLTYLNKVYYLNLRIDALIAEKQENLNIACKCTANYENDGSSSGTKQNSKELLFCKVADQRKEIDDKIDQIVNLRDTISNQINLLNDDTYKTILSLRYLSFKTMQEIADIVHFDKRTVQRKHKDALEKLSLFVTP